jgi:hypothetical protein
MIYQILKTGALLQFEYQRDFVVFPVVFKALLLPIGLQYPSQGMISRGSLTLRYDTLTGITELHVGAVSILNYRIYCINNPY